jgi:uncharacterized protein YaiL (DUF2058 family)
MRGRVSKLRHFLPMLCPCPMSMSLREQLLAAGFVSKKQVKQATHQERQQEHKKAKQHVVQTNEQKLAADKAQAAKAARDLELNRQQQEKAAKKALRAEVQQLVEQNREPKLETDDYFNFIDRERVRRICVTPALRERILKGDLMFVRYRGHYELVPPAIAQRVGERDPHSIVTLNLAPEKVDENDPYKDFVVPDDLTW